MAKYDSVDITGIDKIDLLVALFNNVAFVASASMYEVDQIDRNQASEIIESKQAQYDQEKSAGKSFLFSPLYFGCLYGKPMQINISGDSMDPSRYNKYALERGTEDAQSVVTKLRQANDEISESKGNKLPSKRCRL